MERKIGEVFKVKKKKYKCKKGKTCKECAFDFRVSNGTYFCTEHLDIIGPCGSIERKDSISVIFIEVKE